MIFYGKNVTVWTRARLDTDRTAKPIAELYAVHPEGHCVKPGINALSYEIRVNSK